MSKSRLYRDVYLVNFSSSTGETYTLINPNLISADVFKINDLNIIESPIVVNESVGKFYVDLNSSLYTFDDIFEIKWNVKYVSNSPNKTLITRFRFKPVNIGSNIDLDVENNDFDIEIVNNLITIEI